MIEDGASFNKVGKEEDPNSTSSRLQLNCTQTCRSEGKAGNKKKNKTLASCPKNVSNEVTDHIPTHKSQSQNYIQTYSSKGRKSCGTPEWKKEAVSDSLMSNLCLHHMEQCHKWFWNCYIRPKFLLKGKKKVGHRYKRGVGEKRQGSCGESWREKI